MDTFRLGDVSITRVVEIGRSFYPTADMLPESTAEAIARHHAWLKPDFFDEATGDLGSRIQTWVVRMPGRTILVERHADSGVLILPAHFPRPGHVVRDNGGFRFRAA